MVSVVAVSVSVFLLLVSCVVLLDFGYVLNFHLECFTDFRLSCLLMFRKRLLCV